MCFALANMPGEVKAKALVPTGRFDRRQPVARLQGGDGTSPGGDQIGRSAVDRQASHGRRAAKLVVDRCPFGVSPTTLPAAIWQQKEKVVPKWLDRAQLMWKI